MAWGWGVGTSRVEDSLLHSSNRPIHLTFVSLEVTPLSQLEDPAYGDLQLKAVFDEPETLPLLLPVTHKKFDPFCSLCILVEVFDGHELPCRHTN